MTPLARRNIVGALVFSVALTVIVITRLWPDWSEYRSTVVPEQTAAHGEAARVDGRDWRVQTANRSGGPTGVEQLRVTVVHSGDDLRDPWQGVLTDGRRRWSSVEPSGAAGPLELVFDIPAGAEPTAVDLVRLDGSIALRLLL